MPLLLLLLGAGAAYWWWTQHQAPQIAAMPPALPPIATSGWMHTGALQNYHQFLPDGSSDGGLAASAASQALAVLEVAAQIAAVATLVGSTGYGVYAPAPPISAPSYTPEMQNLVDWASTNASSQQVAALMARYPILRPALYGRFSYLRSIGM